MLYIIMFFGIVLVDQITKTIIDANNVHIEVIEGVFSISNVRNEGAAFSLFAGKDWAQTFFIVMTVVILIALCVYLVFSKKESKMFKSSMVMIMAGAVGNLIDRIALRSVRDFIYPHFFANFNVADIFVCVGALLLAIYIIFFDREFGSKGAKADVD
ncbi:MAG: signal peptidase II [Clostridia bacterium]|nr:signal peptidase II [Clostridia bacterium]